MLRAASWRRVPTIEGGEVTTLVPRHGGACSITVRETRPLASVRNPELEAILALDQLVDRAARITTREGEYAAIADDDLRGVIWGDRAQTEIVGVAEDPIHR